MAIKHLLKIKVSFVLIVLAVVAYAGIPAGHVDGLVVSSPMASKVQTKGKGRGKGMVIYSVKVELSNGEVVVLTDTDNTELNGTIRVKRNFSLLTMKYRYSI